MSEYYAVVRSTDHLAHYGVKGMKWGVRKNPQKQFYKALKKGIKKTGYAKDVGAMLSRKDVSRYENASNRLSNAYRLHRDLEESIYARTSKKPLSASEQKRNRDKLFNASNKLSQANDNFDSVYGAIKNQNLGKYADKKIRYRAPNNSIVKMDAGNILSAALQSQMKPRKNDGVHLTEKQKALENEWQAAVRKRKEAIQERNKHLFDIGGKRQAAYDAANAKARESFTNFYDSMSEKQKRRYHDRYLG